MIQAGRAGCASPAAAVEASTRGSEVRESGQHAPNHDPTDRPDRGSAMQDSDAGVEEGQGLELRRSRENPSLLAAP